MQTSQHTSARLSGLSSTMICPRYHAEAKAGSQFCNQCGTPLVKASADPGYCGKVAPSGSATAEHATDSPKTPSKEKAALLAVCGLLLALTVWMLPHRLASGAHTHDYGHLKGAVIHYLLDCYLILYLPVIGFFAWIFGMALLEKSPATEVAPPTAEKLPPKQ